MKTLLMVLAVISLLCGQAALAGDALPPYTYTGDDPVEAAVAAYTATLSAASWGMNEGAVTVPAPAVFRIDAPDEQHRVVYGNFWALNYMLEGNVLTCVSGGGYAGVMTLEASGDGWKVKTFKKASDGEGYGESIREFCGGDEELEEKYFTIHMGTHMMTAIRERYLREYVAGNGLAVDAYRDYGSDPISLAVTPEGYVITALASEVNPDHLANVALYALITGYSREENALTVALVRTIEDMDGDIVVNRNDDDYLWLSGDVYGRYGICSRYGYTWNTLTTVTVPVTDTLILLDENDYSTGKRAELPKVYGAQAFLEMLQAETGSPGFADYNVFVIFNENGDLAVVQRF